MKRKNIVLSILGTIKDAHGGKSERRWNTWRPNIGLVSQPNFTVDEIHLVFAGQFSNLANAIRADIATASPATKVIFEDMPLNDPWDFEEVYGKFYELAKKSCFHRDDADYYIHISTGSHVEQICLFLLAESHHLPGKLLQTVSSAGHGHGTESSGPSGSINVIDLDLSRYDKLARRFETERQDDLSFLKQGIETRNAAFNRLIETIERVAVRSSDPILLTGPTGAGKSQLAKQIYLLKKQDGRLKGPFVSVNCATLGGDLAKAALFGYRKGAFTGANANHDGYLKEADGGILFLDEIGELPPEAQAMLLKAIEEKTFRPLSATKDDCSDFQLICGTNVDLTSTLTPQRSTLNAQPPTFRADLLARINLWSFRLPGLADRREDIEPNLAYELTRYAQKTGQHITFNREAREKFLAFALDPANRWPGNFRDLNAMVVRMATLSDGGRITEAVVDEEIARCRDCLNHTRGRDCLNRVTEDESSTPDANETFASTGAASFASTSPADLARLLGADYAMRYDDADLALLAHVIAVCRASTSAADAAKKLYAVSRKAKSSSNDSDRLTKYLARFGLKFRAIIGSPAKSAGTR